MDQKIQEPTEQPGLRRRGTRRPKQPLPPLFQMHGGAEIFTSSTIKRLYKLSKESDMTNLQDKWYMLLDPPQQNIPGEAPAPAITPHPQTAPQPKGRGVPPGGEGANGLDL